MRGEQQRARCPKARPASKIIGMTPEENAFIAEFFRMATDDPLDPDDPRYVPLYGFPDLEIEDPVELIARAIEWTPGSTVQLLSGFRGAGKSTELRRLRRRLADAGYVVILLDIENYLNLATQIDITDFLIAIAGAFGDEVKRQSLLPENATQESYWSRLTAFITRSRIDVTELGGGVNLGAVSFDIKANLKTDPSFRERMQQKMAGYLGALVEDVRAYLQEVVSFIRDAHHDAKGVVLLVDSIEHIRGTSVNAREVQSSVESLFAGNADQLHLPSLHVVYTVPPYVHVLYPGLSALYAPGEVQLLQPVKVCDKDAREPFQPGLHALERVVAARGDWKTLLGDRSSLDRLSLMSGGHLRDLLRLLTMILRSTTRLPVSERTVDIALTRATSEFLPIAKNDAIWLHRIAQTKQAELQDRSALQDLARFLDTHLVLCYRNGSDWYDISPLVREEVRKSAEDSAALQGENVQLQRS